MVGSPAYQENDLVTTYLRDISKYQPLKTDEEARLAREIKKGNKRALDKLVKANLRFVISVARNYQDQGVALTDLINEGNMGLIRAAKRFDEKKNFKFISYAVWWIRQAILQALADQSRFFKVPVNRVGIVYKVGKAAEKLEQKLHRKPLQDEIAGESGLTNDHVKTAFRIGQRTVSLDSPISDDRESMLIDVISDRRVTSPDEDIEDNSARDAFVRVLAETLQPREEQIIKLYFGLDGEPPYTLDEIGKKLSITRERVRQLRDRALEKLKKRDVIRQLHDSLN
jgi:RNA polymerase primary sigma factor